MTLVAGSFPGISWNLGGEIIITIFSFSSQTVGAPPV